MALATRLNTGSIRPLISTFYNGDLHTCRSFRDQRVPMGGRSGVPTLPTTILHLGRANMGSKRRRNTSKCCFYCIFGRYTYISGFSDRLKPQLGPGNGATEGSEPQILSPVWGGRGGAIGTRGSVGTHVRHVWGSYVRLTKKRVAFYITSTLLVPRNGEHMGRTWVDVGEDGRRLSKLED